MLVPEIFFELDNKIDENIWLEPVLKAGENLVGGLNEDGGSSLRCLANLEEEEGECGLLMLTAEIRLEKLSFSEDPVELK